MKYSIIRLFSYLRGPLITVFSMVLIQVLFMKLDFNYENAVKFVVMTIIIMILTFVFHFATIKELHSIIRTKTVKS